MTFADSLAMILFKPLLSLKHGLSYPITMSKSGIMGLFLVLNLMDSPRASDYFTQNPIKAARLHCRSMRVRAISCYQGPPFVITLTSPVSEPSPMVPNTNL